MLPNTYAGNSKEYKLKNKSLSFRFVSKERNLNFSNAQRSYIVWQILTRANYGQGRSGIGPLLARKAYTAAYPLHDGEYTYKSFHPNDERRSHNVRKVINMKTHLICGANKKYRVEHALVVAR